jgi:bacteriorhodopsin
MFTRRETSIDVNPPVAANNISGNGTDWLWTVTAIYTFVLLLLTGLTAQRSYTTKPRIFHYVFIIALLTGAIAYFTMASDLGSTPIFTELNNGHDDNITRQIWYARYINWFVSWPLLLTAFLLLTGVSWATILFSWAIADAWVVSWLSGALVQSTYKWGYYVFGVFAYFVLVHQLLFVGRRAAIALGTGKVYNIIAPLLALIWLLYTIAWGVDEGGNEITVTSGQIYYGILDLITVPLVAIIFFFFERGLDYPALGLSYTDSRIGLTGTATTAPVATKEVVPPTTDYGVPANPSTEAANNAPTATA